MGRLCPALLLLLAGCAPIPERVRNVDAGMELLELTDVPFHSQQRYQCGPAALTTILQASGATVSLADIVDKVYLPGRHGSLQVELLAATRTSGRIPYVIDGTLGTLIGELDEARAVVVLQNLGVAAIPRWHYAVVIGFDPDRDQLILRSGTDRRRLTPRDTFLRTWRRSDYWAIVALRPGEIPGRVDRTRYLESVLAFEQAGQAQRAVVAWQSAAARWPRDTVALFGLANARYAREEFAAAETLYRILLSIDAGLLVARNNLAMALAMQGRYEDALLEIGIALQSADDDALKAEFEKTRDEVRQLQQTAAG